MKKCCKNCISLGADMVEYHHRGDGGNIHVYWCAKSGCYITEQGRHRVYCDDYEQKKDKFELAAEEIATSIERKDFQIVGFKMWVDGLQDILKKHFGEQG